MPARLLLVDDDEMVRDSLSALLRQAGYEVTAVTNGQEALDSLKGEPFHLMLLDMLMPVVDGWHVLQHLPKSAPPVIVMTGTVLTREWARGNGCQGFLRKPIEEAELLEEVRRCLGR